MSSKGEGSFRIILFFFSAFFLVFIVADVRNRGFFQEELVEGRRMIEICSTIKPSQEIQVWWRSGPDMRQSIEPGAAHRDGSFWCVLTDVGTPLFPGEGNLYTTGFEGRVTAWKTDSTGSVTARPVQFQLLLDESDGRKYVLWKRSVAMLLGSAE